MLLFFLIALSHFVSSTIETMVEYAEESALVDGEQSQLETFIIKFLRMLQTFVRVFVQLPLLCYLGYFAIIIIHDSNTETLTTYRDKNCTDGEAPTDFVNHVELELRSHQNYVNSKCVYCKDESVMTALITFIYQVFNGIMILATWVFMWKFDISDDAQELREQEEWKDNEEKEKMTWIGNFKEFILIIGIAPFFDGHISGLMFSLAITLPQDVCYGGLIRTYLIAGVLQIVNSLFKERRAEIIELAGQDNIINKKEHFILTALDAFNFLLFIVECAVFASIVGEALKVGVDNENCSNGVWNITLAIVGIYSIQFFFRICVVVGSLMRGAKIAKTDEETGKVEHELENTTEKFEIKEKEKEIMEKEKEEDKKHHIHTEEEDKKEKAKKRSRRS